MIGVGDQLWRAEVVLRVAESDSLRVQGLLDAVTSSTAEVDIAPVPHVRDIERAASYDVQPPAPEAGVGVACWVQADTVGGAAETAWRAVETAAKQILGEKFALWDLRVIPRSAILSAPNAGTPLTQG